MTGADGPTSAGYLPPAQRFQTDAAAEERARRDAEATRRAQNILQYVLTP